MVFVNGMKVQLAIVKLVKPLVLFTHNELRNEDNRSGHMIAASCFIAQVPNANLEYSNQKPDLVNM